MPFDLERGFAPTPCLIESFLAGEWFDGLSRGDDTYFMLTSKTTGNALPVVFILSGFSAHASMGRGAGSDWTADGPVVDPPSIPPIVVKAWMILHSDLALQDAFQAVFPSISRGVWRHFRVVTGLFIYLSGIKALLLRRNCGRLLRRSPLAAELLSSCSKLLERRAVFAYPVCAFRFGRDRGGQFCMSDVWALWTGR